MKGRERGGQGGRKERKGWGEVGGWGGGGGREGGREGWRKGG